MGGTTILVCDAVMFQKFGIGLFGPVVLTTLPFFLDDMFVMSCSTILILLLAISTFASSTTGRSIYTSNWSPEKMLSYQDAYFRASEPNWPVREPAAQMMISNEAAYPAYQKRTKLPPWRFNK
ncbi:hypothetical protein M3Y98_00860400 [Aphelenchoides besseyi]|nr:hypothetical protein M3Y98_00860400 [Aphelenchoides besseyi]KAI6211173.1 hypothetical protein M3Y96_00405800 [Aphelenchoides besseyi]